tara:strand:+ start:896 stop:1075 length:180 start_codon:yes stop_codon:yes gene_type:complete
MKNLINLQKPSTKKRWLIKKDKKTGKIKEVILPYMPDKEMQKELLTDKEALIEYFGKEK